MANKNTLRSAINQRVSRPDRAAKILEMLHDIQRKMGINKSDNELEEMKKELDIDKLHENIKKKT